MYHRQQNYFKRTAQSFFTSQGQTLGKKTHLGKTLRKEQAERDWTLNHRAQRLDISLAYLSHMEMGRRPVSVEMLQKICKLFLYYEINAARLRKQAEEAYSPDTIKIQSQSLQTEDRDLAKMFARHFTKLNSEEKDKMFKILQGEDTGDDE